jgi:hypothetical protein
VLRERACLIGKPQFNFSRSADSNPGDQEDCASAALWVEYVIAKPLAALANGGRGPMDRKQLQRPESSCRGETLLAFDRIRRPTKILSTRPRRQDSRWISVVVLTGDSHSSWFTSLSSFCTRRERRFGSARLQIQMWVSSNNLHYFSPSGRGDLFSAFLNIGEEHRPATSAHRLFQTSTLFS